IIISATLRIIYYMQLSAGPCLWRHLWTESDMNTYHRWGEAVAGGDWLLRDFPPPLHEWHRAIAKDYYRLHPELAPATHPVASQQSTASQAANSQPSEETSAEELAAARRLWERWCGGGRYYHDPLYGYFVGVMYSLFGPETWLVLVIQLALGIVGNV